MGNETIKELKAQLDRIEAMAAIAAKSFLNVREAAVVLGVKESTVYQWCDQRRIPYYKDRKKTWFKKAELERFMCRNRVASIDERVAAHG